MEMVHSWLMDQGHVFLLGQPAGYSISWVPGSACDGRVIYRVMIDCTYIILYRDNSTNINVVSLLAYQHT